MNLPHADLANLTKLAASQKARSFHPDGHTQAIARVLLRDSRDSRETKRNRQKEIIKPVIKNYYTADKILSSL